MKRQAYGFRDQEFVKLKILGIHEAKYALVGSSHLGLAFVAPHAGPLLLRSKVAHGRSLRSCELGTGIIAILAITFWTLPVPSRIISEEALQESRRAHGKRRERPKKAERVQHDGGQVFLAI